MALSESRQITEQSLKQKAIVIWLTGLPCSGKTTLGLALEKSLVEFGFHVRLLDGDITRKGINSDLGFSEKDRSENIRRIAEISKLFAESGIIMINAFITPTEALRQMAKQIIGGQDFVNVYVNSPLNVCENRDIKGMYKKARNGEISDFTGISAPFEPPVAPDIEIKTAEMNPDESLQLLLTYILPKIKITHEY